MRKVKRIVKNPSTGTAFRKSLFAAIIAGIAYYLAIVFVDKFAVNEEVSTNAISYFKMSLLPVLILLVIIYTVRNYRRRWADGYMFDYVKQLKANGCYTCPRCGGDIAEKIGTETRQVHVADEITTTTYSDGSKSTSSRPIYSGRQFKYTYYKCLTKGCAIRYRPDKHYSFSHMPYKKKEITALVTGKGKVCGKEANNVITSRFFNVILAVALVVLCFIPGYKYVKGEEGLYSSFGVLENELKTPNRNSEAFISEILLLDEENESWNFSMEVRERGVFAAENDEYVGVNYRNIDGHVTIAYSFEENNMGTGLEDGYYLITTIDGKPCIIDDENELIYFENTDFYQTYYSKLLALTYDYLLQIYTNRMYEANHVLTNSGSYEVLKTDKLFLSKHTSDFIQIVDETGEKRYYCEMSFYGGTILRSEYETYKIASKEDKA